MYNRVYNTKYRNTQYNIAQKGVDRMCGDYNTYRQ